MLSGRGGYHEACRAAIVGAIDHIAASPDSMRIIWHEMTEESGVGRQLLKRRVPPLFAMGVNFIFRGQRAGEFREEVDPFHFLLSLNSITIGFFTTAAMVRRLWNNNLLEPAVIERRKREVIDMVERTLFVPRKISRRTASRLASASQNFRIAKGDPFSDETGNILRASTAPPLERRR